MSEKRRRRPETEVWRLRAEAEASWRPYIEWTAALMPVC
jgi:hypothetical protein